MASATGADVLYFVPRYLTRSERFVWQQLRDWSAESDVGTVRVACRRLTDVASEFPHDALTLLGGRSRLAASADHRFSKLTQRSNRTEGSLSLLEHARLERLVGQSDVLYCMFLWNAIELLPVLRTSDLPFVVHVAGSDITTAASRGADYLTAIDEVLGRADLVLCGSEFLLGEVLMRGVEPARCRVHYFGIDVPTELGPTRPAERPLDVVAISRLHPVKGVAHTLTAFDIAFADTDATLTIIGDGPERATLEMHADALRTRERITFTGELPHAQVNTHLGDADLFVQHNVTDANGGREGCGGTLLEASAHEVAVVGTRSGGVGEAIIDGQTGLLVEPGDVAAMADAMVRLAEAPDLRAQFGQAGRTHVGAVHNSRTQNQRLARLLALAAKRDPQLGVPHAD